MFCPLSKIRFVFIKGFLNIKIIDSKNHRVYGVIK